MSATPLLLIDGSNLLFSLLVRLSGAYQEQGQGQGPDRRVRLLRAAARRRPQRNSPLLHGTPAGRSVLILSGDKDMYQLVTDRVLVLNTAMRPGQRLIGAKEIEARYGGTAKLHSKPARFPGTR
jgi:5'-3' exonuclease